MLLPRIIAHRGESGLAPENTLIAIEQAVQSGATWVELDANVSSDGIVYIHHDDTLDRCTNLEGYLISKTSSDLDRADAGSWFDASFSGEPLPRLSAVIDLLAVKGVGLNLEIKPSPGWEEPTTHAVCETLNHHWPPGLPLIVSSFSERAMQVCHRISPNRRRGFIVCAIPPNWHDLLGALECQTLHCAGELLTQKDAVDIKSSGFGLLCWTINNPQDAQRLFSWGVDSVFTDYPSRLLADLTQPT